VAGVIAYGLIRAIVAPVVVTGSRETPSGEREWYQPARDPYAGEKGGAYTRIDGEDAPPGRWIEVGTDGTAFAAGIFAQRAQASLSLSSVRIEGQFMRLWEPDATKVSTLDYYSVNAGLSLFGSSRLPAELVLKVGASGISGASGVGYGFDTRIYPARPVVVYGALDMTSFSDGPPLVMARLGPGLVMDRYEVKLFATLMHQADAVTTVGPSVSMAMRF